MSLLLRFITKFWFFFKYTSYYLLILHIAHTVLTLKIIIGNHSRIILNTFLSLILYRSLTLTLSISHSCYRFRFSSLLFGLQHLSFITQKVCNTQVSIVITIALPCMTTF